MRSTTALSLTSLLLSIPVILLPLILLSIPPTYASPTFTCDDDLHLPSSYINDDYCDCLDRSDEPLTSACSSFNVSLSHPPSTFLCPNVGFLPLNLSTTFFSDSLCDCCDGSDEAHHSCPNSCPTQAQAFLTQQRSIIQAHRAALSHRTQLLPRISMGQAAYRHELLKLHEHIPSAFYAKREAEAKWEALPEAERMGARAQYEALTQAQVHYNYLSHRHRVVTGALTMNEMERMETEEEAALRVKEAQVAEKRENKEKRARGEKVRKKSAKQLQEEEEAAQPRLQLFSEKAPSLLLSDVFLALHSLCVSTLWEERLYGDKGVTADHYLVTLCPLHNATQTKLQSATSPPDPTTPPIVLGYFEGVIRTTPMLTIQRRMDTRQADRTRIEAQYRVEAGGPKPDPAALLELQRRHNESIDGDRVDEVIQRGMLEKGGKGDVGKGVLDEPVYWMRYFGGEQCYGVGQREVLVKAVCGGKEALREVRENGKCRYEMVFETGLVCESKWTKDATKHLDELEEKWREEWKRSGGEASPPKDEL